MHSKNDHIPTTRTFLCYVFSGKFLFDSCKPAPVKPAGIKTVLDTQYHPLEIHGQTGDSRKAISSPETPILLVSYTPFYRAMQDTIGHQMQYFLTHPSS